MNWRMRRVLFFVGLENRLDRLCLAVAWRLPRRLVNWCGVRMMAHATQGPYSDQVVPELLAMDVLKRWEAKAK